MRETFGTSIGIVSLPATYRSDPVVWAWLTHEVGGHDVVHADPELVAELVCGGALVVEPKVRARKKLDAATLNALIWSHWMDEAVADVYGILNMGPVFPINARRIHRGAARENERRVGWACRGRPSPCFPPTRPRMTRKGRQ